MSTINWQRKEPEKCENTCSSLDWQCENKIVFDTIKKESILFNSVSMKTGYGDCADEIPFVSFCTEEFVNDEEKNRWQSVFNEFVGKHKYDPTDLEDFLELKSMVDGNSKITRFFSLNEGKEQEMVLMISDIRDKGLTKRGDPYVSIKMFDGYTSATGLCFETTIDSLAKNGITKNCIVKAEITYRPPYYNIRNLRINDDKTITESDFKTGN